MVLIEQDTFRSQSDYERNNDEPSYFHARISPQGAAAFTTSHGASEHKNPLLPFNLSRLAFRFSSITF